MSVILSKHGSVRGMEGGVGKAVESFREKTKKLTISPVLQRIQEVGITCMRAAQVYIRATIDYE